MNKVKFSLVIPANSIIKDDDFGAVDYQDAISIQIETNSNYTIDYLTSLLLNTRPRWVLSLLKVRDFLVKPFKLKTSKSMGFEESTQNIKYNPGEKAGYFKVLKRNDSEIVMFEDDKHLNFRTSVMIEKSEKDDLIKLYSITIVKYNNLLGKLYFIPVKPFHKIIISTILKILSKNLKKNENENY